MKMAIEEDILGAVARGWTTKRNEHKIMDSELAEDIALEVMKVIRNGN